MSIVVLIMIFLAPLLWILSSSFEPQTSIFKDVSPLSMRTFVPGSPTWANYAAAFDTAGVGRALLNSLIIAVAQVTGTLLLAVPAAYALARLRFRGRTAVFVLIMITFMVPGEVIVVPLFQITARLHLQNSLEGVFLPWIAYPLAVFLLRQAFLDLPREFDEAAKIDGAGHWRIIRSIIVPNARPAIATVAIATFLYSWNAFLWPLLIISSTSKEVIQVAIAVDTVPGEIPNWGEVFAGAMIASAPVLILFSCLQRYFVRSITMSGLSG
jgi:ABC-type glycerol-3-phosphate transport system permease component